MNLKANEQFNLLITRDIAVNYSLSNYHCQSIIVANDDEDILMLIENTHFDLILLELTVNYSKIIASIKNPFGINNKTPIIAVINSTEEVQKVKQYLIEADDWLIKPISEKRLNETIDIWQTKAIALAYIQTILNKTKSNQRLTLTIFEKLFEELPQQIINIREAFENKQYDYAKELIHKINGSMSFCGLTNIQQLANNLESCLLNNDYAAIDRHFQMLQQCILNFTCHQKFIIKTLMNQFHKKSP